MCPGCGDRLYDRLWGVPELCVELQTTECRLDVLTPATGAPAAETGLPYKPLAADAASTLRSVVCFWAVCVNRDEGVVPADTSAAALFLARRLDWLRAHEDAGQAYSELNAAMSRAMVAVDRPLHRTRFEVGPCPCVNHEKPCPGAVFAYIPVADSIPAVLRCRHPDCGAVWTTDQWLRVGRLMLRRMGRVDG